jgi:hypothetical protein
MQELYNRSDGEAALAFYHPEIEWVAAAGREAEP